MYITRLAFFIGILGAVSACLYGLRRRSCRRHQEAMLDESLEDSFPASDPPATQDFRAPDMR
jgi:hypothetical protein